MTKSDTRFKVFIAGASGAIGRPLIKQLKRDGHTVFGMTRSIERSSELEKLGATPIIADALDETSVKRAIESCEPDIVIEMLTSLPKEYTPEAMKEASALNTKLKLIGGAHLQKAAEKAGVKRYILQSTAFWYAPGSTLATEEAPLALDPSFPISEEVKIYETQEKRVLQSTKLKGVSLRFGFFYGPGTWYAKDGSIARQVLSNSYPIVGDGSGIWNFIHVEDAAIGISKALNAKPGIYNLTDGAPQPQSIWLPAYAKWLGAPPPLHRTEEEELKIGGPTSIFYATKLRAASNQKAKDELDFHPRKLEWTMS